MKAKIEIAERKYHKGDRVQTSGAGRTAEWGHLTGTVTQSGKRAVFVVWDGTHFEDQMSVNEVTNA